MRRRSELLAHCWGPPALHIFSTLWFLYLSLWISQSSLCEGFPCGSAGKESACNAGDLGLIPGLGRSPGEGKGHPVQYCGLENSMDCIVHGVTKSWTWLSDFHFTSLHFPMWTLVTWGNSLLVRIFHNQGAVLRQNPRLNIWGEYHLGRKVKDPLGGPPVSQRAWVTVDCLWGINWWNPVFSVLFPAVLGRDSGQSGAGLESILLEQKSQCFLPFSHPDTIKLGAVFWGIMHKKTLNFGGRESQSQR